MNNFPSTQSGFKEVNEGVLEEVIVLTEKQGIYCMNPAHLGSVCNVRKDNFFCDTCHRYGPPTKEFKKQLPELQPIIFSRPIFFRCCFGISFLEWTRNTRGIVRQTEENNRNTTKVSSLTEVIRK